MIDIAGLQIVQNFDEIRSCEVQSWANKLSILAQPSVTEDM